MKKIIRTLPELQALKSFKVRHSIKDVSIELPGSFDEIRKLETEINKSLKACGCEMGAVFVVIGLLALVILSVLAPNFSNWTSPETCLKSLVFLATLALAGKVLGLVIANWRLQLIIENFEHDASRQAVRK